MTLAVLLLLSGAISTHGQTQPENGVPLVSQVIPPSIAVPPSSSQIVTFSLTIVGANFSANPAVTLALPQGPSIYPASVAVNASGTQIVAQFNARLPRPGVYWLTVADNATNPTHFSNVFYLPVTLSATTVGVVQDSTGFLSGFPEALAVGDFNGDGNPDLAVVSQDSNTVSILLGAPGGIFNPGASYPTGNLPSGIVAADLNGDGVLDLAFTNAGDNTVSILLGNGDGTFRLGTTVSDPGIYPTRLVAADFNADGALDLAVINLCGPGTGTCYPQAGLGMPGSVTLLLGNGDGTFTVSANSLGTGIFPSAIAAADLNADGAIDLVIANQISNTLTLLMGNGDGTFTAAADVPTGGGPSAIAVADFNNDGKLDLAVTNVVDETVSVFLNQNCGLPASSCTFPATNALRTGRNPSAVSAADMNADGYADLVVLNASDSTVTVIMNNGAAFANFIPVYPVTFSTNAGGALGLAIADFNGDGRLDMATLSSSGGYSLLLQTPVPQVLLTVDNASPLYGAVVTFTATVVPALGEQPPTGWVTLYDGTNGIASALLNGYQATFSVATLTLGAHQITAAYCCDPSALPSTSLAVTETVSQAQTTLTLSSNVNTVAYGQSFTLSATAQSQTNATPTGTVSFLDTFNFASLGSASLSNGVAQLTLSNLAPGPHGIIASYNGSAGFAGSTSPTYTENITQASTTTTATTSASPVNLGQTPTFTAAVQPSSGTTATGSVTFFADGSTQLGTAPITNNSAQLRAPVLPVGSHSITAQYTGDTNYTGSSSSPILELVNPAADSVSVSTSSTFYGQPSTFVATVQPVGYSGTPTGTITFSDGTTVLGTGILSNGSAQFTTSTLTVGSHPISASYTGDANFQPATSAQVAASVLKANATTTVTSGQNPSSFGQALLLTATVQPVYGGTATGTVTFLDGSLALGTSTLSGNTAVLPVSSLTSGSHAISAGYAGDNNVVSSTSASITQTVNSSPTSVTLTSNANPTTYGQNVTLSATVQSSGGTPTGSVTFVDGTSTLGTATLTSGVAQFPVSTFGGGSHSITARYSGDTNFLTSTSAILTETVNELQTTTTLGTGLNPATFGQAVTLTATVQAGSGISVAGMVTFLDGSLGLGTVALANGSAQLTTSTLAPGAHTLTAVYNDNGNFAGSTSAAITETINPLNTTTTLTASVNPALAGQSVTFTATVQAGAGNSAIGTVTFLDGLTTLGSTSVINNSAQLTISTLALGSHSITAAFSGSTDFASSTSSALTETVNQSGTTTTLVSNLNPATFGQGVPLVATVQTASGGAATGTVTFYDGANVLGITGVQNNNSQHNTAQLTVAGFLGGTHTLTAAYSGDTNYTASTSTVLTQTINRASSSVTVGASSNPASFGQTVTLTATVVPSVSGGTATGTVTFFDGASSLGSANLSNNAAQISVGNFPLGSHSITATYAGDRNFAGSTSAALSETVNPAASSTVLTSSANPILVKSTVTFTATVSSSSPGTQTGTVGFYLDGSSTAAASVNLSNGTAQYSTNSLSAGSHSVVAVFNSTNPDFASSTSSAWTQFVSDFTVAVSPSSLTVARGTSGTYTLTITPIGEFSGTVSLTCGGAPGSTTCSVSPTQVTLNGSNPSQATVAINAAPNASKGTHTLTFTATSGGLNHKVTASLTID